jgi:vacuolar-type H+-ATPase subunit C/Vma6
MREEAVLTDDSSALTVADAAAKAFATGGALAMNEATRVEQKKLYDQGKFSPYSLAETYALMGHKQEAVEYLRAAYDRRSDGVSQMGVNSRFRILHDDPGFQELLAKVGVPATN